MFDLFFNNISFIYIVFELKPLNNKCKLVFCCTRASSEFTKKLYATIYSKKYNQSFQVKHLLLYVVSKMCNAFVYLVYGSLYCTPMVSVRVTL